MNNPNEKKIIIMDDHPLYLSGLKHIINDNPAFCVLDCCRNTAELLFSLSIVQADIAILDFSQPEGESDMKDVVEQLHQDYPQMSLVAMGESRRHQLLSMALRPRIKSYFCKSLSAENILLGLRHVQQVDGAGHSIIDEPDSVTKFSASSPLSAREKFIIEYLHAGLTVSQVAYRVNRSVKTVSTQKRTAMRKLGITQNREIFQLNLSDI